MEESEKCAIKRCTNPRAPGKRCCEACEDKVETFLTLAKVGAKR